MSTSTSDAATKRGRRELIGLALVCIAPVAASYFLYYGWQPSHFKNYGDLIPLAPVAALAPVPKAAPVDDLAALRGKWLLVMTDAGACEKSCRDKLWQLRQLRLTQGKEMDRIAAERESSQPLRSKTGGSTFKNPAGHKAWQLVDEAGCRGLKVGGAQVSEKHTNFLLNLGDATSADIEALGEEVRKRVKARTGIELEWEIQRVGVFADDLGKQCVGVSK